MEARLALPVSVEQAAVVIKQMSRSDRERLLDLAPELRQMSLDAARRQGDQGLAVVERMRGEVSRALGGQLLSLSEPFLGDLTLGQYLELPDEERGRLWDAWVEIEPEELAELDVHLEMMAGQEQPSERGWQMLRSLGADAEPGRLPNAATEHDRDLYAKSQ